ncbi:hypothetical protein SODALDRAFT_376896 [Sodiomyces alkalinus F11]|uniref:Uncharacterized protein n=1 Tax=Sodiomyces alkalinus (strain CBS 110278 / VKM F-3762 / F11) TaxID=1314773 RepID=A0A3N2Q351_SODAK|nr:hypothetical protein SODALDRAFT_376896 [Sodiomyces alkalinus F11]ROT41194.1 hypothetical protein SODALDRAFT_376896 [Sodiomyces alkalinus F11]
MDESKKSKRRRRLRISGDETGDGSTGTWNIERPVDGSIGPLGSGELVTRGPTKEIDVSRTPRHHHQTPDAFTSLRMSGSTPDCRSWPTSVALTSGQQPIKGGAMQVSLRVNDGPEIKSLDVAWTALSYKVRAGHPIPPFRNPFFILFQCTRAYQLRKNEPISQPIGLNARLEQFKTLSLLRTAYCVRALDTNGLKRSR